MPWQQIYRLWGLGYGASALFAALPIVLLFLLLGVARRPVWVAALISLLAALLVARLFYRMPGLLAISACLDGAAFGLFPISWIVLWALVLFRLTAHTGQLQILKRSISSLTPDPRLQALLVGFAFAGFLEGAAGFGTPVAIAASLLIGVGFEPFSASAICLLANTTPVAFGSIGIPLTTLSATTGLPLRALSTAVAALCTPLACITPAYLLAVVGGPRSLRGALLPATLCGLTFAGVQCLVAVFVGPQLPDLLAGMASIGVLVAFCRLRREQPAGATASYGGITAARATPSSGKQPTRTPPTDTAQSTPTDDPAPSLRQSVLAWTPYLLLVACMLLWSWPPLLRQLTRASFLFAWPGLHNHVLRTPPLVPRQAPYAALFTLNWLSAAGTACLVACLLSALLYRVPPRAFGGVVLAVLRDLRLPTLTITAVLALAFLMNYSGATGTLGLALAATGRLFPFFSVFLGWLGVFLTGSDTSANALFGNLQVVTATRLGLPPVLFAAANSTGGVMGKMISLQTIAIAASATGMIPAEQIRLFRFTLRHSLALAAVAGGLAWLALHIYRW